MGAKGKIANVDAALRAVAVVEQATGTTIHILDAEAVCGPAHLASALIHARRSHERKRARARDAKVEMMLYLAGARQIARAMEIAGLSGRTKAVALAIEGTRAAAQKASQALFTKLGLVRDDAALAPSTKKLRRLEVPDMVGNADDPEAIAMEHTASLDVE